MGLQVDSKRNRSILPSADFNGDTRSKMYNRLEMTNRIIGISAYYHDAAACLMDDGRVLAAAQEERFTRKKHDASFPINAIRYCLETSKLSLSDIDAIVFYEKPLVKFERLIETYLALAPKGLASFLKALPIWMKEKLLLKA